MRQKNFTDALLDLGATMNVMPYSVYCSLGLEKLSPTSVILQLANKSFRKPMGFVEDVLIRVKDLTFLANFFVLDKSAEFITKEPLILGRPFLWTANTMISLKDGTITLEIGKEVVKFNVFEAMKHPFEEHSLLGINKIDLALEEVVAQTVANYEHDQKHTDYVLENFAVARDDHLFPRPFCDNDEWSIIHSVVESSLDISQDTNLVSCCDLNFDMESTLTDCSGIASEEEPHGWTIEHKEGMCAIGRRRPYESQRI